MKEAIFIECTGCATNCHLNIIGTDNKQWASQNIKENMNRWKECRKGKEYDNEEKISLSAKKS